MGHVHEISLFLTLSGSRVAWVEIVTMMNSKIAHLLWHHRRTCTNTPSVAKEINNNILRDDLWDKLRLCVQNVDLPNEENARASESEHVSMAESSPYADVRSSFAEIALGVVGSFEFGIQIFVWMTSKNLWDFSIFVWPFYGNTRQTV